MLAHAFAAAERGASVDLAGYAGTPLPLRVASHPRIAVHRIATGDATLYIGAAIVRAAWRAVRLIGAGLRCPRPDVVLVQTPPAIPGLLAARVVAVLRGSRLVVDWHSFSDAVLARRMGAGSLGVRWLRAAEQWLARGADAHLAVSEALAAELRSRASAIEATVAPDLPVERVPPLADHERAALRARYATAASAFLVAPTSWNGDDDFQALIDALTWYDERAGADLPSLSVLITGTGPLRAAFDADVRRHRWQRVFVRTAWLEPDEYPSMLAAADVGLSLHATVAGVDPPIKLVDMLGAGLPSCVLDANGAAAFTSRLMQLLEGFPRSAALEQARVDLASAPLRTWLESWPQLVAPRLASAAAQPDEWPS